MVKRESGDYLSKNKFVLKEYDVHNKLIKKYGFNNLIAAQNAGMTIHYEGHRVEIHPIRRKIKIGNKEVKY